jgi:alpha-methylacyl-CoA racemase
VKKSGGPLSGIKIVEIASAGPGPFAAMLLSDLGAEIIRVDRPESIEVARPADFVLTRGRRSVVVDLQAEGGAAVVLRLAESADVLIEGFRPGVAERLGIGPEECQRVNGKLIYGRMTGWGQDGPYASSPGHDINYIAITGLLKAIGGKDQKPSIPLNLLGDFGGGGMLLVVGILAAIVESRISGEGQVIDASMVDGAALLTTSTMGVVSTGKWQDERQSNSLDGGYPYYDVYLTSDDEYMSVGALEPKFYKALMDTLGISDEFPNQYDRTRWPDLRQRLTEIFRSRSREEWSTLAGDASLCLSPVQSFWDAPLNVHNRERGVYIEVDGVVQPAPAPRFSRTPATVQMPPPLPGEHTSSALLDWGFSEGEIVELSHANVIRMRG